MKLHFFSELLLLQTLVCITRQLFESERHNQLKTNPILGDLLQRRHNQASAGPYYYSPALGTRHITDIDLDNSSVCSQTYDLMCKQRG
jgi:hypothetical protein